MVSCIALMAGLVTCLLIALDIRKRPQHMRVMNVTWPITGLYLPVAGWLLYRILGRAPLPSSDHHHGHEHHHAHHHANKPLWKSALVDNTHCGGGCTIGDIVAGPIAAITAFSVAGSLLMGHFVASFIAAFVFGIAFQYSPKREMNPSMSRGKALVEALKADTLSVICYQIGMYIWLLICAYGFNMHLDPFTLPYWFMMQIAMLLGFITVYPANLILIKTGIKEAM